jgi:hypothetical protein
MRQRDTLKVALIYPPEAGEEVMAKAADWQYGLGEAVLEKGRAYREILDFTYSQIAEEAEKCDKKISGKRVQTFTYDEKPMYPIMAPERLQDIHSADLVVAVDPPLRLTSYISETVQRGPRNRALIVWTSEEIHQALDRLLALRQTPVLSKDPQEPEREAVRRAYGFYLNTDEPETDWILRAYLPTKHAVRFPEMPGAKQKKKDMFALRVMQIDDPESQTDFRQFMVEPETDAKDLIEKKAWVKAKIKELGLE